MSEKNVRCFQGNDQSGHLQQQELSDKFNWIINQKPTPKRQVVEAHSAVLNEVYE